MISQLGPEVAQDDKWVEGWAWEAAMAAMQPHFRTLFSPTTLPLAASTFYFHQ